MECSRCVDDPILRIDGSTLQWVSSSLVHTECSFDDTAASRVLEKLLVAVRKDDSKSAHAQSSSDTLDLTSSTDPCTAFSLHCADPSIVLHVKPELLPVSTVVMVDHAEEVLADDADLLSNMDTTAAFRKKILPRKPAKPTLGHSVAGDSHKAANHARRRRFTSELLSSIPPARSFFLSFQLLQHPLGSASPVRSERVSDLPIAFG